MDAAEKAQIGRRRAAIRVLAGFKKVEAARRAGLANNPIQRAEDGGDITAETCRRLAELYGVSPAHYQYPPAEILDPTPQAAAL